MNTRIEERLVLKKSIKKLLNRLMITIIIFLIGMITIKAHPNLIPTINKNVYEKNFKFTKARNIYEKYFGNILSLDKVIKEETPVFNEQLAYTSATSFKDGAKLKVSDNYMVPALESGIVVFLGEKENYGTTVIIEQVDGVDTFYANINPDGIKLYDYIEKGQLLGEAKNNNLYLAFQKNGEYLNYKEYV